VLAWPTGRRSAPNLRTMFEGYIADRVRLHRNPPEIRVVKTGGGRWLQVHEGHTSFGGIVGVRTDITERKQLEHGRRWSMAVTRLLADSETVGQTMPKVIQTICETLGWIAAPAATGSKAQHPPLPRYLERLRAQNRGFSSEDCARQPSRRDLWAHPPSRHHDRSAAVDSRRLPPARFQSSRRGGGRRAACAFAFPIRVGSRLVGAMEFFTRNVRQPDAPLLRILESIGLQIASSSSVRPRSKSCNSGPTTMT